VAAGQRYLHSPASLQLASYILEVRPAATASIRCSSRGRISLLVSEVLGQLNARRPVSRSTAPTFPEQRGCLGQCRGPHHVHASGQTRLNQPVRGHDDPSYSPPCQSHDHGKKPRNRPQFAAQRQFAQYGPAAVRLDLLRADENSQGNSQVQRRAALAQLGRGKIHGDAPGRVLVTAVADCSANSLAGLLQSSIRQADDGESRQSGRHVHLDANEAALQAVERGGEKRSKHSATLRGANHLWLI